MSYMHYSSCDNIHNLYVTRVVLTSCFIHLNPSSFFLSFHILKRTELELMAGLQGVDVEEVERQVRAEPPHCQTLVVPWYSYLVSVKLNE